jgi:hypothetical protein
MIELIRSHPYAAALAGTCLVVILGTLLVLDRTATPSPSGVSAWSGNTAALATSTVPSDSAAVSQTITASTLTQDYGTATLPYTANEPVSDSQGTIQTGSGSAANPFDLNALLAELSQKTLPSSVQLSTTTGNSAVNAWAYVPTGLIAIATTSSSRSASQQALYQYGNEAGSYVEGYDAAHHGQAQVLSDAQNDRQNATKAAAVENIGQDLETVGQGLAELSDVPAAAAADNTALSASYIDIGKKLIAVGQAEPLSDSALVSAIETYDSAVNSFNGKYIALSTMFSSYGVTFSTSDPGSVFSFTSNAL